MLPLKQVLEQHQENTIEGNDKYDSYDRKLDD